MRHPTILRIMNQSHATPRTMNEYLISFTSKGLRTLCFFFGRTLSIRALQNFEPGSIMRPPCTTPHPADDTYLFTWGTTFCHGCCHT